MIRTRAWWGSRVPKAYVFAARNENEPLGCGALVRSSDVVRYCRVIASFSAIQLKLVAIHQGPFQGVVSGGRGRGKKVLATPIPCSEPRETYTLPGR